MPARSSSPHSASSASTPSFASTLGENQPRKLRRIMKSKSVEHPDGYGTLQGDACASAESEMGVEPPFLKDRPVKTAPSETAPLGSSQGSSSTEHPQALSPPFHSSWPRIRRKKFCKPLTINNLSNGVNNDLEEKGDFQQHQTCATAASNDTERPDKRFQKESLPSTPGPGGLFMTDSCPESLDRPTDRYCSLDVVHSPFEEDVELPPLPPHNWSSPLPDSCSQKTAWHSPQDANREPAEELTVEDASGAYIRHPFCGTERGEEMVTQGGRLRSEMFLGKRKVRPFELDVESSDALNGSNYSHPQDVILLPSAPTAVAQLEQPTVIVDPTTLKTKFGPKSVVSSSAEGAQFVIRPAPKSLPTVPNTHVFDSSASMAEKPQLPQHLYFDEQHQDATTSAESSTAPSRLASLPKQVNWKASYEGPSKKPKTKRRRKT